MLFRTAQRFVVLAVVALSARATPPPGHIPQLIDDKHPPKYEYGYVVSDKEGGTQGHVESRDGIFALGRYYVSLPDGSGQKVTYFADDWGYHPLVTYSSSSPSGTSRTEFAMGDMAVAALKGAASDKGKAPLATSAPTVVVASPSAGTGVQVLSAGASGHSEPAPASPFVVTTPSPVSSHPTEHAFTPIVSTTPTPLYLSTGSLPSPSQLPEQLHETSTPGTLIPVATQSTPVSGGAGQGVTVQHHTAGLGPTAHPLVSSASPLPFVISQLNSVYLQDTAQLQDHAPKSNVYLQETAQQQDDALKSSVYLQDTAQQQGQDLKSSVYLQDTAQQQGQDLKSSVYLQDTAQQQGQDLKSSVYLQDTTQQQVDALRSNLYQQDTAQQQNEALKSSVYLQDTTQQQVDALRSNLYQQDTAQQQNEALKSSVYLQNTAQQQVDALRSNLYQQNTAQQQDNALKVSLYLQDTAQHQEHGLKANVYLQDNAQEQGHDLKSSVYLQDTVQQQDHASQISSLKSILLESSASPVPADGPVAVVTPEPYVSTLDSNSLLTNGSADSTLIAHGGHNIKITSYLADTNKILYYGDRIGLKDDENEADERLINEIQEHARQRILTDLQSDSLRTEAPLPLPSTTPVPFTSSLRPIVVTGSVADSATSVADRVVSINAESGFNSLVQSRGVHSALFSVSSSPPPTAAALVAPSPSPSVLPSGPGVVSEKADYFEQLHTNRASNENSILITPRPNVVLTVDQQIPLHSAEAAVSPPGVIFDNAAGPGAVRREPSYDVHQPENGPEHDVTPPPPLYQALGYEQRLVDAEAQQVVREPDPIVRDQKQGNLLIKQELELQQVQQSIQDLQQKIVNEIDAHHEQEQKKQEQVNQESTRHFETLQKLESYAREESSGVVTSQHAVSTVQPPIQPPEPQPTVFGVQQSVEHTSAVYTGEKHVETHVSGDVGQNPHVVEFNNQAQHAPNYFIQSTVQSLGIQYPTSAPETVQAVYPVNHGGVTPYVPQYNGHLEQVQQSNVHIQYPEVYIQSTPQPYSVQTVKPLEYQESVSPTPHAYTIEANEYSSVVESQQHLSPPPAPTVEIERPVIVEKPVAVETTKVVEVEKPVHVDHTKIVEVEKPVPILQPYPVEITKVVHVDRPVAVPAPYTVAQPIPIPFAVPHAVVVPYPEIVPFPYKEYHPVFVPKPSYPHTMKPSHRLPPQIFKEPSKELYEQSYRYHTIPLHLKLSPTQPHKTHYSEYPRNHYKKYHHYSGRNRNALKNLRIEYGGFKPPLIPSEEIKEEPKPSPYGPSVRLE